MRTLVLLTAAALTCTSAAQAQTRPYQIEAPSWSRIERFESDAEFQRYLRDTREAARRARALSRGKQEAPAECPPELEPCFDPNGSDDEAVVVTGARISAAPPPPAAPAAALG